MLTYALIGLGGIIILGSAYQWWQDKNVRRWPSVEGKIRSSTVEIRNEYKPKVLYEYTVQGVTHQGSEIANCPLEFLCLGKAEKLISRYTEGETVRVFYDPGHPEVSVLDRTPYSKAMLVVWVAIGCVLWVLGVAAHPRLGGAEETVWKILGRLFAGAGFLIMFGLGLFLIFWALRKWWRWHTCKSWPSVEGRMIRSSRISGTFTPWTTYRISTGVPLDVTEPSVTYEYTVCGVTYEGSEISNSFYISRATRSDEILTRHPEGKIVRVYFNPNDPQSSLLDPTPGGMGAHLVLLFIVLVGAFALCMPFIPVIAGEVEVSDALRWWLYGD